MATEKQYGFFLYLYEQENSREKQLNDYAKGLISLTTLYSGLILFVAEKMRDDLTHPATKVLFCGAMLSMLAGFLLSVWATRLTAYQALNDPDTVVAEFGQAAMTDEVFYDNRIADCTVAANKNSLVNDGKAGKLLWSAACLALGIFLHAAFFLNALI